MLTGVEGATGANATGGTTAAITFNTSGANRICVLEIYSQNSTRPQVSTVTSSNVTWEKRFQLQYGSSIGIEQNLEIWWGYAATQLTNEAVSIGFNNTIDDAAVIAFAIPGEDPTRYTQPFDGDASLPVSSADISGSFVSASGVLSTQSNSALAIAIWAQGVANNGNNTTTPSGWTSIRNQTNTGGVNGAKIQTYYTLYTGPQQNTTVLLGSTKEWGIIFDVISGDVIHPKNQVIVVGG